MSFLPAYFICLLAVVLCLPIAVLADVASLQRMFESPPDDARIMTRWWWYGPAVTKPMLDQEMQTMKAGGFGGFEVQPTYPLTVDGVLPGVNNIKFLSPEFYEMLNFTAARAKELGLRMDLTLGSGWPYGGPMFSRSEAAGQIFEQIARPAAGATTAVIPKPLVEGQTLIAAFAVRAGEAMTAENVTELKLIDNVAQIPSEMTGLVEVRFYISGRTGMKVKRPAMGAEGWVIDHLSEAVTQKFIKEIAEPSIAACGTNPPYSVFCDSLEVGGEDWTDGFLEEFKQRRGYDLRPLLPALFNDKFPRSADIRHDWGKTLTETYNDRFNKPLRALAKAHNTRFRQQAYGSPSAALFSYTDIDLPEGEGFKWREFSTTRYAASAAHLMGVPVVSSETFTWLHSPVFRATPLDMKAEADLHFLQGVNQIICHGWPATPPGVTYPGWSFYAAGVFNEKNPWWIVMPDVTKYMQRISSMMRQGKPVNDVAVYLANSDAWAHFTPGKISLTSLVGQYLGTSVGTILDAGYNLDFFDDGMLDRLGKVDGTVLAMGDLKYKVVALVGVERIPVSTMRTLETLAKNGGTVVAFYNLPSLAAGYSASDAETQEVRDIAGRLFTGAGAPGILIKADSEFAGKIAERLAPDVAFTPARTDFGVVHRHTENGEVYFIANTSNAGRTARATFRVDGLEPEAWDPMSGHVRPMKVVERTGGRATIELNLPPYGSTIIVWSNRAAASERTQSAAVLPQPVDISQEWSVTFAETNDAPVMMEKLVSWHEIAATRNFSGVATYRKSVEITAEMLRHDVALQLDFGEGNSLPASSRSRGMRADYESPVREAAVVYVNDKRVGSVWHPPYTVQLGEALKEGKNYIRIEVANLAISHMAGSGFPNYDITAARTAFGNRFDPQDVQNLEPLPSGILGPVKLIAMKKDR